MLEGVLLRCQVREDTYVYGNSLWRLNPLAIIRYHWALLMGPKSDRKDDEGVRYHARERVRPEGGSEWVFEELTISMMPTQMILVRIMLAKIEQADTIRNHQNISVGGVPSQVLPALPLRICQSHPSRRNFVDSPGMR